MCHNPLTDLEMSSLNYPMTSTVKMNLETPANRTTSHAVFYALPLFPNIFAPNINKSDVPTLTAPVMTNDSMGIP